MRHLNEYQGRHAGFFERLGFTYFEEPTTDSVRRSGWLFRFRPFETDDDNSQNAPAAPFHLVLFVEYELAIGDACGVCMVDNLDYCFQGVYLELREMDKGKPVGRLRLPITTTGELKAFWARIPSAPAHPRVSDASD